MKVRVLGAGIYGCHIASTLLDHDVEVHETASQIFAGASGGIPARLHMGQHYPRSGATREACQRHHKEFMSLYGHLTSAVRTNIYAIAAYDSLMDFPTYCKVLKDEIDYIRIYDPKEYGLQNIEGAILTGERHLVIRKAIAHFEDVLGDRVKLNLPRDVSRDDKKFDITIDCTFCANDSTGIDRYEPCLTVILEGPKDWAVTVMDGPFGGVYAWDQELGLSTLTSAKFTPFSKECKTYAEAKFLLDNLTQWDVEKQTEAMFNQMSHYWPSIHNYRVVDHKFSIRAMPRSGSDARLVSVNKKENIITVRAGKIDAILDAEKAIKALL